MRGPNFYYSIVLFYWRRIARALRSSNEKSFRCFGTAAETAGAAAGGAAAVDGATNGEAPA